jgi:hypothetical protein
MKDVLRIVRKVVNGSPGVFGTNTVRGGQSVVDMLLCTPVPQRVSAVCGESKWKRKGARGEICDARWPAEKESPRAFLRKWADAIARQQHTRFGSRSEVFRALDSHYERDRARKRQWRVGRRRPSSDVHHPSPHQCVVDTSDLQPTHAGVAQLTEDEVGGFPWTPHDFADVDLRSVIEGLLLDPSHSEGSANGSEDTFLCAGGISTSEIDVTLASCGVIPSDGCDLNLECGFDFDWNWDCNTEMVNVDVNVNLDWNPEWNDLLDVTDLVV